MGGEFIFKNQITLEQCQYIHANEMYWAYRPSRFPIFNSTLFRRKYSTNGDVMELEMHLS